MAVTALRGAPLIVGGTLLVSLLAIPPLLLMKNVFTASVAFVPEQRPSESGSQLSTLASLAGISSIMGGTSRSPAFYKAVLEDRPLRYAVLQRRYPATELGDKFAGRDSATLVEILDPDGDTPEERLWIASDALGRVTVVGLDLKTSMLSVNFTHRSRLLAAAVVNAYAEEITRFNLEERQSHARTRRVFVERRLREAADSLGNAEDAVRGFLQRNRQYETSPTLVFELGRLQRTLTVHRELYLDLRRQLDAARIEEVDDQPAVTVVRHAIVPQRKSAPRRSRLLMQIAFVTAVGLTGGLLLRRHHEQLAPGLLPLIVDSVPRLASYARRVLPPAGATS